LEDRLPFESELIARTAWLIRLRWWAVAGTTLAVGLGAVGFPGKLPLVALWGVTAFVVLYNLAFSLYFSRSKRRTSGRLRLRLAVGLAQVQIVLDLVALAALVHLTGGAENPAVLFFVFHVIVASILLPRRVSYGMAGLAALLFAAVAGLEYVGFLPHYPFPLLQVALYREPLYVLALGIALTLTLFLVAYFTTSITARLRERDRELMDSNRTCQVRSTELERLNDELRRLDRERTRLMVLVTHELRAPISTIYSALELALAGYASPEKTRKVLGRAQSRASDLLTLIGELLDLTRVREQEAQPPGVTEVQLADVLRDVVEFMRVEAEGKDLDLEVDIAPGLAPVKALPDQAKLVWTNLLSNAIKYSRPGGRVHVSLRQEGGRVVGSVADTGIGIATEDLPHVFDEFFRAGNARQVSPHGTGVGLAIVRRIVENWGGAIWVEAEPDRGSTFTFAAPVSNSKERTKQ
jgi:signal transduction histidine kinase